jgi:hypothetical protein
VELRGLREDLAHPRQPSSPLSRADRERLATLLPAIGGVFGSDVFLVRELFESEASALTLVLRGLNARQVGRLLRRAADQVIDGYLIQRHGHELHATLWCVAQVPEFSTVRNLPVPPRASRGLVK